MIWTWSPRVERTWIKLVPNRLRVPRSVQWEARKTTDFLLSMPRDFLMSCLISTLLYSELEIQSEKYRFSGCQWEWTFDSCSYCFPGFWWCIVVRQMILCSKCRRLDSKTERSLLWGYSQRLSRGVRECSGHRWGHGFDRECVLWQVRTCACLCFSFFCPGDVWNSALSDQKLTLMFRFSNCIGCKAYRPPSIARSLAFVWLILW